MIRNMHKADVQRVADIWLDTNKKAHYFIPGDYWEGQFEAVKEMLLQAEVYVYEDLHQIQGFIGLEGDNIAGIFVWRGAQSRGIGKCLMEYVKDRRHALSLSVYQKNTRALRFYQREQFEIAYEGTDPHTGEKEYIMTWKRQ